MTISFLFLFLYLFSLVPYSLSTVSNILRPMTASYLRNSFTLSKPNSIPLENLPSSLAKTKFPYSPKGISFAGGPVMSKGVHVYIIWYGSWSQSQKAIVKNFILSLGPKGVDIKNSVRRWWELNGLYYDNTGAYVSTNITFVKDVVDSYSFGSHNLSNTTVRSIVTKKLTSKVFPYDTNGIYVVLSSQDVSVDGFCSQFCAYHDFFTEKNVAYKFAFVGNAETQCSHGCIMGSALNGDVGIDGMIGPLAHELTETTTDPTGNAWYYPKSGNENADQCIYQYGYPEFTANGSLYNLVGNSGEKYLVQLLLNPQTGTCVTQVETKGRYPPPPPPLPAPYTPLGIAYNGGEVMDGGVHVYIIWYGSWKITQKKIITSFIRSMGPQSANVANSVHGWWSITSLYYNAAGKYISSHVSIAKEVDDNYSSGKSVSDFNPILFKSKLPMDSKGIYLVLTSDDVQVSNFCTNYCAFHAVTGPYKYIFVGNGGTQCPYMCTMQQSTNGDVGVDGMVYFLALEMTATVTDPIAPFGWSNISNRTYTENSNLCYSQFGSVLADSSGNVYNVIGGDGKTYLLQQNWNPRTGTCVTQA